MPGKLLFVGAHPDDEIFFTAGTFARYSALGAEIHVLCATLGQKGKTGGLCTPEELAEVRRAELHAASEVLGIRNVQVLPYMDKELGAAPVNEVRTVLVKAVRGFRPHILMTFDPHGSNLHPDHIAMSRFVSDALMAAADGRWYPELGPPFEVPRLLWTPPRQLHKLEADVNVQTEPGFDFLIDVANVREQKIAAFQAHRTQFVHIRPLFFDGAPGERTFGIEAFRFGGGVRPPAAPSSDLFEGLNLADSVL